MIWSLSYSREVRNYIFDSYPYTEKVWQAIKSLRQTEDGLPSSDWQEIETNLFSWVVAEHFVVIQRDEAQQRLTVVALKPFNL